MPKIDREALERAAAAIGIYPGCQAFADLVRIAEAYEAEPPALIDRQS